MVPPIDKQQSMAALQTDAKASEKGRRPMTAKLINESAAVSPRMEYLMIENKNSQREMAPKES